MSYLDSVRDSEEMAVDDEVTAERSEVVYETKITLVGEAELESTINFPFDPGYNVLSRFRRPQGSKEHYARIDYIHIYALSPSFIHVCIFLFFVLIWADSYARLRNQPFYASPQKLFEKQELEKVTVPVLLSH